MKRVIILATVLTFSLAFVGGAMAAKIKVGTLMAYTGALKEYGPPIKDGVVLAARQLTDAGLEVEVFHEDTETSPIAGTNAAKKLVEIDNVVGIVGALSSGVTLAVAESVTIPNNVIMISPASTNPLMTELPADKEKDFLFRTCPSDALQGVVAGDLCARNNKTASVIYVNNAYGQGLAEVFKESFEEKGGEVLAMVPVDEKVSESYTAELRKALSDNPDRLCAFTYPEHAKVYVKEAIEFFDYKRFLFCDGTKSIDIVKAVGAKNVEGQKGTAPGTPGGEAYKSFNAFYKEEFGKLPNLPFITNAYDGAAIIGLAAYLADKKGLELNPASIRDQLREVSNPPGQTVYPGEFEKAFGLLSQGKPIDYEGAAGSVNFDENGDVATPIEIWEYQDGEIVTMESVTPEL